MSNQNAIDIILVTYNRLEFTKKVIDSLCENTILSFRLIVVDNCSTDNTQLFLIEKKDAGFIQELILNTENKGLEVALNQGLKRVQSKYFVTIDNDIIVSSYWLPKLLTLLQSNPDYAGVSCRPQILIGVGTIFRTDNEIVENNVIGGSARLLITEKIKEVGGWEKHILNNGRGREEWDICGKLKAKGYKVGYAKNIFCFHMFGEDEAWGYLSSGVDYKMGRVLDKSPKDIKYDRDTCRPSVLNNE